MRNPLVALGVVVLCCMTVPIIISVASYRDFKNTGKSDVQNIKMTQITDKNQSKKPKKEIINYETVNKDAPTINIYNHKLGKDEKKDIEKYLYGVLAGEMPSEFDIEALKAQAIAARTFVIQKKEKGTNAGHKNSVVCTDFRHCQEYKSYEELQKNGEEWMKTSYPKIKQAVDETKGQIITYEGKAILPLYFSTSSGKTENSEEVFSGKYTYLQSVDSPYDKNSPKYTSTLKISNKDFVNTMSKSYVDMKVEESNLNNQIRILERSTGGAVEKIKVGNKEITGRDIRNIFGINSANFEIDFNDEYINILVKGYGHGVGMSQWGADGMAKEGYKYYEILTHYYTGTQITDTY
ncbi:MAG: stage II sporulation protein D [Romboutsia sp.]